MFVSQKREFKVDVISRVLNLECSTCFSTLEVTVTGCLTASEQKNLLICDFLSFQSVISYTYDCFLKVNFICNQSLKLS